VMQASAASVAPEEFLMVNMVAKQAAVSACIICLLSCSRGPDPQRIGVFAETDAGIVELVVYGSETQADSFTEGLSEGFSYPQGQTVPTATSVKRLYVNLPDARIEESKVYILSDLNARWHLQGHTARDPQPLTTQLSKTDRGVYELTSDQLHANGPGYVGLLIKMPLGAPDRLYVVQLSESTAAAPASAPESPASPAPGGNAALSLTAGLLFATGAQGEGVYEIDLASLSIAQTAKTSLFNNQYMAWDRGKKRLYVAGTNGGAVSILADSPLREIGTMSQSVGWNTFSMALSPDGGTLFLTCASQSGPDAHDDRIVTLDTSTRAVRTMKVVGNPQSVSYLALSFKGDELYLSRDGGVDVYDPAKLERLRECPSSYLTSGRVIVPKNDPFIYVEQPGRLVRLRSDCSQSRSLNLPGAAANSWASSSARNDRLWVGSERGGVYEVDTRRLRSHFMSLRFKPEAFSESRDGRDLYVATGIDNVLLDIDTVTGKEKRSVAGIKDVFGLITR
jgi:DNA-binding beta-propeller fold protein YncE